MKLDTSRWLNCLPWAVRGPIGWLCCRVNREALNESWSHLVSWYAAEYHLDWRVKTKAITYFLDCHFLWESNTCTEFGLRWGTKAIFLDSTRLRGACTNNYIFHGSYKKRMHIKVPERHKIKENYKYQKYQKRARSSLKFLIKQRE